MRGWRAPGVLALSQRRRHVASALACCDGRARERPNDRRKSDSWKALASPVPRTARPLARLTRATVLRGHVPDALGLAEAALAPVLAQIDSIEAAVATLEGAVGALDARSHTLEQNARALAGTRPTG